MPFVIIVSDLDRTLLRLTYLVIGLLACNIVTDRVNGGTIASRKHLFGTIQEKCYFPCHQLLTLRSMDVFLSTRKNLCRAT